MKKMTTKLKALFDGRELPKPITVKRPNHVVVHETGRPEVIKDFGRYFEDRPASTKSMGMSVEDFGKAVTGLSQAKPPYSSHAWLQNGDAISEGFAEGLRASQGDTRYKEPKEQPLSSFEEAEEVIHKNDIYSMAREKLENVQRKQVAYGLDKYPEPLNADTWSIEETIDHIMDETMDTMHYLAMLQIKLNELPTHKQKEYDDMMDAYKYSVPNVEYKLNYEDMQPVELDLDDEPEAHVRVNVETSVTMSFDTQKHTIHMNIEYNPWDTIDDIKQAIFKQVDKLLEGRDV